MNKGSLDEQRLALQTLLMNPVARQMVVEFSELMLMLGVRRPVWDMSVTPQ